MSESITTDNTVIALGAQLVYAAKTGANTQTLVDALISLRFDTLTAALATDDAKKAFWINIYNGYVQMLLDKAPQVYETKHRFFNKKQIHIADHLLSLDDIEHGILRRSKIKWSLGYVTHPFPSAAEKALRTAATDYRIHFALNCGAASCPPIAFYTPEKVNTQLELATQNYLNSEVNYDNQNNVVYLPALMRWFRADFGGKQGMLEIAKQHGLLPAGAQPRLKFKKYNWTLQLHYYTKATA